MTHCVKRLSRGHDLKRSMADLMESSGMRAAVVTSLVGSLTHAKLRAAGGQKILDITGPVEITGATGTLSPTGMHVHIAIADANGATFGGHLIEGCIVSSTVEVVLSEVSGWQFNRLVDADTGHQELVAQKAAP